jgi:uncharacterized GH25 family protein
MKFFLSLLALSMPLLTAADDFYLMPSKTSAERMKVGFHNGYSFPQSESSTPIDKLKDVLVFSKTLNVEVTNLKDIGTSVEGEATITQKGNLVVTACTMASYVDLQANDFEKYIRQEGLGHVLETPMQGGSAPAPLAKSVRERFSQYAKSLLLNDSSNDILQRPVGAALEFIPEKNPAYLRRDERLPVRVLWNGKPAVGLQVEAAYTTGEFGESRIVGRTDRDGRVYVTLGKKGFWRLHTVAMERCRDPRAADFESSRATLTFEIR